MKSKWRYDRWFVGISERWLENDVGGMMLVETGNLECPQVYLDGMD